MNRTVVPLTDLERRVLSDFAEGDTPAQIAAAGVAKLDDVNGILSRRVGMSRTRAAGLLADPDPRELSPLTAPVVMPAKTGPPPKVVPTKRAAPAPIVTVETTAVQVQVPAAPATRGPFPDQTTTGSTSAPTGIEALLAQTDTIGLPRVRNLAGRVRQLVETLREMVAEEQLAAGARRRVAELEAELEAARKLLPEAAAKKKPTRAEKDAMKAIRKWAGDNNIDCPTLGRIPHRVLNAYRKAHPEAGAA